MAYTQQQIDELEAAIAQGALSVRAADGKSVTFRSLKEMRETLALMKRDVAGAPRRPTYGYLTFDPGHD